MADARLRGNAGLPVLAGPIDYGGARGFQAEPAGDPLQGLRERHQERVAFAASGQAPLNVRLIEEVEPMANGFSGFTDNRASGGTLPGGGGILPSLIQGGFALASQFLQAPAQLPGDVDIESGTVGAPMPAQVPAGACGCVNPADVRRCGPKYLQGPVAGFGGGVRSEEPCYPRPYAALVKDQNGDVIAAEVRFAPPRRKPRMNPMNARAAGRAARRLTAASRAFKRIGKATKAAGRAY